MPKWPPWWDEWSHCKINSLSLGTLGIMILFFLNRIPPLLMYLGSTIACDSTCSFNYINVTSSTYPFNISSHGSAETVLCSRCPWVALGSAYAAKFSLPFLYLISYWRPINLVTHLYCSCEDKRCSNKYFKLCWFVKMIKGCIDSYWCHLLTTCTNTNSSLS